jgi:hypothetical protein
MMQRNMQAKEHSLTRNLRARPAHTGTRFAVVAWSGAVPVHLSPRAQRTAHLVSALKPYGAVERIGGENIPQWLVGDSQRTSSSWYRRRAKAVVDWGLMDKYEIVARQTVRRWSPNIDAAVLVGHPYSPLPFAAQKLAQHGIPYLVDTGDPWMLTNPQPEGGELRRSRAAHWERRLWASARGAIVTTEGQGSSLTRLFPHLRILVRPNGYTPVDAGPLPAPYDGGARSDRELRLVHYGSLHGPRVDFHAILERLASSKRWDRISLCQYGADWESKLESTSTMLKIEHRAPISWADVVADAHNFDAAVVIGWKNPAQLPSKAVQYLTLPLPRIAMVNPGDRDALAAYVADKPGWVAIDESDERCPEIVASHVSRRWAPGELQAPESESWTAVERVLGEFALDAISTRGAGWSGS